MKKLLIFTFLCIFGINLYAQDPKKNEYYLKEYIGTYKMETFFESGTITEKEGFLYAELDSYGINKLIKQEAADTFISTSSYGTVFTFLRDENKRVIGVKLKIMDNEVNGKKIQ